MVVVRPWKLPVHHHDGRLVGRHALDVVPPPAAGLDRGLDRLGAGVHRQHQVLAGERGEVACERPELVVVERPAGQRHPFELALRGGDQARVAVAEVQRGVAAEAVEVAVAVDVLDPGAPAGAEHDRQRVVVVRGPAFGELDVLSSAPGRPRLGHVAMVALPGAVQCRSRRQALRPASPWRGGRFGQERPPTRPASDEICCRLVSETVTATS